MCNQSADKLITGRITKQDSKHIRWMLVQVAQAALKKRDSKLRKFFLRIKARKGHNVAVVAIGFTKILCILYHLLMNQEMYQEDGVTKSKSKIDWSSARTDISLQTMIEIIAKAGYEVKKIEGDPRH